MNSLSSAHQGYIYQDIVGALLISEEIANGRLNTSFKFDQKITSEGVPDKFDDVVIYDGQSASYIQIKYSNQYNDHILTKSDFSSKSTYDLALYDLYKTWLDLHSDDTKWRVCLAWTAPSKDDNILEVLSKASDPNKIFSESICYKFDCDSLWPNGQDVLDSWRSLKAKAARIDRNSFKRFLDCLIIEVECPKSSLLKDFNADIELLLYKTIERIGIGIFPNDHLQPVNVAERICSITRRLRSSSSGNSITCHEVAQEIKMVLDYGGIEQIFPIEKNLYVETPNRLSLVIKAIEDNNAVILTAEPGAGKSWFIESLERSLQGSILCIKHYCYTSLSDPLTSERITVNTFYGSLIQQLINADESLANNLQNRFASDINSLNSILSVIDKKVLLIIDGLDHIWRIYKRYRSVLPEDKTAIIRAISQLDVSNKNVHLLVVTQPIAQLDDFENLFHLTLPRLNEDFTISQLNKNNLLNYEIEGILLSTVINEKSQGNALYSKYLIDQSKDNRGATSFKWISELPPYDFNLRSYYKYLYQLLDGNLSVPFAFCGADFSLTALELEEVTHLGGLINDQISRLKPILKYNPSFGYSIYHESFKRHVIAELTEKHASVNDLVYAPIIRWLERLPFFSSSKAYSNLLKLYYEIENYNNISNTIAIDFLDKSFLHAQTLQSIRQNHQIQKLILNLAPDFTSILIVSEQAKVISELDTFSGKVVIDYLRSVEELYGSDFMYRVFWDGETLLISYDDAIRLLSEQTYALNPMVHWSILPDPKNIPYEILPLEIIKLICLNQFQSLDNFLSIIEKDDEHKLHIPDILDEVDWYILHHGSEWIVNVPTLERLYTSNTSDKSLIDIVEQIIDDEKFRTNNNWLGTLQDLAKKSQIASESDFTEAIDRLSNYNWFRNWLIYYIKISRLTHHEYSDEKLIVAFSFLVKDLETGRGSPRVVDLYHQLKFIKRSFHKGLLLARSDKFTLQNCIRILEEVTNLTTGISRSYSGPLKDEEFLELISKFMPDIFVLEKYEEYYRPIVSRRLYQDAASVSFGYARVLWRSGNKVAAVEIFGEGIQALTSYGYRKDRTLSELLDCSVAFQKAYDTLSTDWFYELYEMAVSVVNHTDGRSTSDYPIDWFEEFLKVYPEEALRFLVSETLESSTSNWYQENGFYYMLKSLSDYFTPTQWYLLCCSLPLASSDEIISIGIKLSKGIDANLRDSYKRWLICRPFIRKANDISEETINYFEENFGTTLEVSTLVKKEEGIKAKDIPPIISKFESIDEAIKFIESNSIDEAALPWIHEILTTTKDEIVIKKLIRKLVKSSVYRGGYQSWMDGIFADGSNYWCYLQLNFFAFYSNGWNPNDNYTRWFRQVYQLNPSKALSELREVIGYYVSESEYPIYFLARGLILTLIDVREDEAAKVLFTIINEIVKRRLPHPSDSQVSTPIYNGLTNLNRDEIFVSLLLARLKTLTTEKTQGIIYALTYISSTKPEILFKPYIWVLSNWDYLLPIHRALLLQVLIENIELKNIPDELISLLLTRYPTGFFLEDQFIRSFINYKIALPEFVQTGIVYEKHSYDLGFFIYIHPKHMTLANYIGSFPGAFGAYEYKRDQLNEKLNSYFIREEKVMTPTVSLANASYEIINNLFYSKLKAINEFNDDSYAVDLEFYLDEIILQLGSRYIRPSCLPKIDLLPVSSVISCEEPFTEGEWVLIASEESELYGDTFKRKQSRSVSIALTDVERPKHNQNFYAQDVFEVKHYMLLDLQDEERDSPISHIHIADTLEFATIVFISPFVLKQLGLHIGLNFHNGLNAFNGSEELVVKMITWKQLYFGGIDGGTEVPSMRGVATLIRADYYQSLVNLYQGKMKFVINRKEEEVNNED